MHTIRNGCIIIPHVHEHLNLKSRKKTGKNACVCKQDISPVCSMGKSLIT